MSKIKYLLRLPSGTEFLYSGYPDFTFFSNFLMRRTAVIRKNEKDRKGVWSWGGAV